MRNSTNTIIIYLDFSFYTFFNKFIKLVFKGELINMVESYRVKSKLATAIGGICTIISVLGVNQLEAIFPEYGKFIPAVVALATWYLSQSTENKRVEIAEQLVHEQYEDTPSEPDTETVDDDLDGEDETDNDISSDDNFDEEE